MSKRTFRNISNRELKNRGVSALANRPNVASTYGQGGLSPTELKNWFDNLGKILSERVNTLQTALSGGNITIDEQSVNVDGQEYISIKNLGETIESLKDLTEAIKDGSLASLLLLHPSEANGDLDSLQNIVNDKAQSIADILSDIENLIHIPSGGVKGEALVKNSNADGDIGWRDVGRITPYGGFAGGFDAEILSGGTGGAVGYRARAVDGGAIGDNALALGSGGAVGYDTKVGNGFAGGKSAKTLSGTVLVDAVQLGTGTNPNPGTLQIYDKQLLDAQGKIPIERIPSNVKLPVIVFTPTVINPTLEGDSPTTITGMLNAVNTLYKSGGIMVQILSSEDAGDNALGMLGMVETAITSSTTSIILHAIPPVLKPKVTNIMFKQATFNLTYDAATDSFTECTIASMQTGTPPIPVDNTTVFTPTADYNPATKKYVDDIGALKVNTDDVVNDLTHTDTDKPLSANQGKALKTLIDGINTLLNSDNVNLDSLQEIVDYIENHQDLLDGITTSKVNVADIINNLTSNVTNKPLSAAQGYALKGLVNDLTTALNGKASSTHTHTKSNITDFPTIPDISGKLDKKPDGQHDLIDGGKIADTYMPDIDALPSGGIEGQVLVKTSTGAGWADAPSGGDSTSSGYSQAIATTDWGNLTNGYYYITISAATHNAGDDNTIQVTLRKQTTDGYVDCDQFNVSANGSVTIYTDEIFEGVVIIGGSASGQGKSAYEIAVDNGFQGTEAQWLVSLKGIDTATKAKTATITSAPNNVVTVSDADITSNVCVVIDPFDNNAETVFNDYLVSAIPNVTTGQFTFALNNTMPSSCFPFTVLYRVVALTT